MSSLVVDTNLAALDTISGLSSTNTSMDQVINELSTGLKVQSASTSPAAYAIGQNLEAQSNGFSQAITNAQDGVSLLQTTQGAINQIMSALQTMNQLALTSANAAGSTTTSLAANESEFTALVKTITEIATTTTFGKTKLLTGAFSGTFQVGAFDTPSNQVTTSIAATTPKGLGLTGTPGAVTGGALTSPVTVPATGATLSFKVTTGSNTTSYSVHFAAGTYTMSQIAGKLNNVAGANAYASVIKTGTKTKLTIATVATGATAKISVTSLAAFGFSGTSTPASVTGTTIPLTAGKIHIATASTFTMHNTGGTTSVSFTAGTYTVTQVIATLNARYSGLVTVSATSNRFTFTTSAKGPGASLKVTAFPAFGFPVATGTAFGGAGPEVSSGSGAGSASIATSVTATKAIGTVQAAINKLSTIAAKVGSQQDELNVIVANLTVGQQNLSVAEAQLVDTTMAQAMTQFTTDNILMQTGIAMLSQAQATPSLVLKLL